MTGSRFHLCHWNYCRLYIYCNWVQCRIYTTYHWVMCRLAITCHSNCVGCWKVLLFSTQISVPSYGYPTSNSVTTKSAPTPVWLKIKTIIVKIMLKMRKKITFFASFTTLIMIYVEIRYMNSNQPFDFVMGSLLFSPSFLRGLPLFRVMAASFFLVVLQISIGIFSST